MKGKAAVVKARHRMYFAGLTVDNGNAATRTNKTGHAQASSWTQKRPHAGAPRAVKAQGRKMGDAGE